MSSRFKASLRKLLSEHDANLRVPPEIPILAHSFFRIGRSDDSPLRYAVTQRYEIALGGHCIVALRCSQRQLGVATDVPIGVGIENSGIFWRPHRKPKRDFVVVTDKVIPVITPTFSTLLLLGRVVDSQLATSLTPQQLLEGAGL